MNNECYDGDDENVGWGATRHRTGPTTGKFRGVTNIWSAKNFVPPSQPKPPLPPPPSCFASRSTPNYLHHSNSNPSLTPSQSPSISNRRKDGAPPPPPGGPNRPSVGRPPHPAAKPPPPPLPPTQNKGGMLGGDASNHHGAPVPPVRSSSAQQSNNGPYQQGGTRASGRRSGPAPAPPIQRPSRPPPMRPPTQPPPPPPVTNTPGGRSQGHHQAPPPPPPMQPQSKQSVLNNSHTAPLPPTRKNSLPPGQRGYEHSGDSGSFEARFSSMFKTPQFLPPPEPFIASTKTYPSRNTGQSTSNNYNTDERRISIVERAPRKSRKAVPAP